MRPRISWLRRKTICLRTVRPCLFLSDVRKLSGVCRRGQCGREVCGENVYHLFVTCQLKGALSKAAESRDNAYAINLTPETHDQSFAMTSSFSNMMLATMLCFNLDKIDEIAAELEDVITAAERLANDNWSIASDIVSGYDFNRIVYLGANALKGIAQESQLKMLELTA